ncbi:hypothetical protein [Candidatus Poriferisodalis sp.]|uniref:hypothetical protein n=1 Tax=Candidatus Poriferisodalis sp. TaxID=3101277 RepID=UPI003B01991D
MRSQGLRRPSKNSSNGCETWDFLAPWPRYVNSSGRSDGAARNTVFAGGRAVVRKRHENHWN